MPKCSAKTVARAIDGNGRLAVAGHAMTFDELVDYVTAEVPRLTQAEAGVRGVAAEHSAQHPTLSPEGLIPYVTLPLAGAGAVTNGSSPLGVKETGP